MLLLLAPSTTGDGGLEEMGSMGLSHNKGAVGFSAGRGVARSQRSPSREPILLLSAASAGSFAADAGKPDVPWADSCLLATDMHRTHPLCRKQGCGDLESGTGGEEAMLRPTPVDT